MPDTWQNEMVQRLRSRLEREDGVSALVLCGSLANASPSVDYWSDVDLVVHARAELRARLFSDASWLDVAGRRIGLERHVFDGGLLLRTCYAGFRRVDAVLLPPVSERLPRGPRRTLWTRPAPLPADEEPPVLPPRDTSADAADAFWFAAAVATAKTVRDDLLIALHLALGLARWCLELEMLLRDRALGSSIHRTGGFGNEIAERVCIGDGSGSPRGVLDLIGRCCGVYDDLARDLWPWYEARGSSVAETLEKAREAISAT